MSYPDHSTVIGRVIHLRRLLMVHSYLYYGLDDPVVSDDRWQSWANDLVELQDLVGWAHGFYDYYFEDWTGATGMHLPQDEYVQRVAERIRRYQQRRG